MDEKFILKSKTIVGGVLLLLRGLGIDIPFTDEELSKAQEALWVVVGFGLVVWGRKTATKPLGFGFGRK